MIFQNYEFFLVYQLFRQNFASLFKFLQSFEIFIKDFFRNIDHFNLFVIMFLSSEIIHCFLSVFCIAKLQKNTANFR